MSIDKYSLWLSICELGNKCQVFLSFVRNERTSASILDHFALDQELNAYFAFLFELIAERGPSVGLNVNLSRYDLFHGHLFIADSGRLGIL